MAPDHPGSAVIGCVRGPPNLPPTLPARPRRRSARPSAARVRPAQLAEAVTSDFASRELFLVKPGLWLGALCSTESRLLLCHLEVKSICTLASHPIDELWSEDGIEYLTGIVSAVCPVRGQLDACVGFLRANEPDAAIVCCSSGIGVSALVASAVVATCGVMDAASAIESVRQAVGCTALDISPPDIADLRQFLSMTPLTPTLRPSVPKAGDEMSPMSKLASQMAGKRARDAEQSTPLKPTPPAARPDERAAGLVITA